MPLHPTLVCCSLALVTFQAKSMGGFQDSLVANNVSPMDVPIAVVLYQFVSIGLLAITWTACYYIQPMKTPIFTPVTQAVEASGNSIVIGLRTTYAKALVAAEGVIAKAPMVRGRDVDTQRLATALAESSVFRKFVKPITFPGKLWVTWRIMEILPLRKPSDKTAAIPRSKCDRATHLSEKRRWQLPSFPKLIGAGISPSGS